MKVMEQKKHFQAILKLDMQKAYDKVEWDFLEAYLLQMGFHGIWVQWVIQCITKVSLSVKFNGEPLSYFHPTRGLRQGDPLSPYMFIILANVLSTLIKQAVGMRNLKGVKFNRWCPTLSHLFFTDDAIFS